MKKFVSLFLLLFCALTFVNVETTEAQLVKEWETMWVKYSGGNPSLPWMANGRAFTGLAYDKKRDYLYIVSPVSSGGSPTPNIYIWNASTGDTVGRLSMNPTVIGGGFSRGVYCLYKVQVNDSGQIYACNLVSPVWGICLLSDCKTFGPPCLCLPDELLTQGPFKIYTWQTPTSQPKLAFKTAGSSPGDSGLVGGMTWTRWGDAFSLIGTGDSMRVFSSGGDPLSRAMNSEFDVWRTYDANADSLVLDLKAKSSLNGFASHGLAAENKRPNSNVWCDNNLRVASLQTQTTLPNSVWEIPPDVTDSSGAIRYFELPEYGRKFVVVADGKNETGFFKTRARIIDITDRNQVSPEGPPTPPIGNKALANFSGLKNWCGDVSYRLEGTRLWVYVLMSNNGIGAYRTLWDLPVELSSFKAEIVDDNVQLKWYITSERFNVGWQVQRSANNGADWEILGFVNGRGTTQEAKEYLFSDPIKNINGNISEIRYRLKQIDLDGTGSFSPIVHVLLNNLPQGIDLSQNYPNPFNPTTTITYRLNQPGFVTMKLFSSVGQEIKTLVSGTKDRGTHLVTVDASDLASGVYYYQLNALGSTIQKKMVVQK